MSLINIKSEFIYRTFKKKERKCNARKLNVTVTVFVGSLILCCICSDRIMGLDLSKIARYIYYIYCVRVYLGSCICVFV